MPSRKGVKLFHNVESQEAKMFAEDPGPPWVSGRPPWQPQTRDPASSQKASDTFRKRLREQGQTEAELRGYEKLSKTRKENKFRHPPEILKQIGDKLRGRPQVWVENKSRASCRRGQCDTVYILKLTTPDGKNLGKWGSSKESTFKYREKEFKRKHFTFEIVYWEWFGEMTEEVEALLGRKFSPYRDPEVPHFYGHTETFAWTQETQTLLSEVLNGLEKSPAP
jgi:hypothetical protein